MHASGSGGQAPGTSIPFALSPFLSHGLGEGGERGPVGYTLIGSGYSKHDSESGAIARSLFFSPLAIPFFWRVGWGLVD